MSASHAIVHDDRNANILIGIRDGVSRKFELFRRNEAKISVFDSGFLLGSMRPVGPVAFIDPQSAGDGLWEGIRCNNGVIQFAKDHLDRLYDCSRAIAMTMDLTKQELLDLLHHTVDANGFQDEPGIHIRLIVSRGLKATPHQNPLITIGSPTIVIIPEVKVPDPTTARKGLRLFTVHVRRGTGDVKDESWNHLSKATDISACIQANAAGVDEALMLDNNGFVKTCNSVNFFIVRRGEVWAPTPQNQMQGITRQKTLDTCRALGISTFEKDFTLTSVYSADEVFVTGTFPAQLSVIEVDGRVIGDGRPGPMVEKINSAYKELVESDRQRGREAVRAELA